MVIFCNWGNVDNSANSIDGDNPCISGITGKCNSGNTVSNADNSGIAGNIGSSGSTVTTTNIGNAGNIGGGHHLTWHPTKQR